MSNNDESFLDQLLDHLIELAFALPIIAIFVRFAWEILTGAGS